MKTLSELLLVTVILFIAGCATGALEGPGVRVIEYGATGGGLLNRGELGGCTVIETPGEHAMAIDLDYRGERCRVKATSR